MELVLRVVVDERIAVADAASVGSDAGSIRHVPCCVLLSVECCRLAVGS